jgi:hypothetical protein
LQGSYKNATNVRGDSDVDVVVEYQGTFHSDISALDFQTRQRQQVAYAAATYSWEQLRSDVFLTLQNYYGRDKVRQRDKCIKVDLGAGRIVADVVPAVQYKKYSYFLTADIEGTQDGIFFRNQVGNGIVNFPKYHIDNGEAKNSISRTNGWYKPLVRVFKNARRKLVSDNVIVKDGCSSYCVECLVYNASDNCFSGDLQASYVKVLNYLWTLPFNQFTSQNGIVPLFGSSPTQWSPDAATALLTAFRNLWLNWR